MNNYNIHWKLSDIIIAVYKNHLITLNFSLIFFLALHPANNIYLQSYYIGS